MSLIQNKKPWEKGFLLRFGECKYVVAICVCTYTYVYTCMRCLPRVYNGACTIIVNDRRAALRTDIGFYLGITV